MFFALCELNKGDYVTEVRLNPGGLPETVIPSEELAVLEGIAEAESCNNVSASLASLLELAESHPASIAVWRKLGDLCENRMEAYAYYRLAYHRGLDSLRHNGWRGSGFVRWEHKTNRHFLVALDGLKTLSEEIGDSEEATRCFHFLLQLEPNWLNISSKE